MVQRCLLTVKEIMRYPGYRWGFNRYGGVYGFTPRHVGSLSYPCDHQPTHPSMESPDYPQGQITRTSNLL